LILEIVPGDARPLRLVIVPVLAKAKNIPGLIEEFVRGCKSTIFAASEYINPTLEAAGKKIIDAVAGEIRELRTKSDASPIGNCHGLAIHFQETFVLVVWFCGGADIHEHL
jgi:hypothetical protein